MQENAAQAGDNEMVSNDLGPLAWVLDELRKSLDGGTKALRRFVRDAELARGSDLANLDASQLRIARQQLHQAVGALEMVGMPAPAKVLRAMEAAAQRFVQRPELCSDEAANKVERASFALTEYLEGVLKGKKTSPVALFPQYRDVLELVGEERVHPADLWPLEFRWQDVALPTVVPALAYDSAVRARIDGLVLKVVKSGDAQAAQAMHDISLGFAAAQSALEARVFWKVCAAYFQAVALALCAADVYGKRAASRILLQYRTLAKGEPGISERLVQDLLFFCAQADPSAAAAPELAAVRAAYGLDQHQAIDYETAQFGRFDPAVLAQARKRIAAATETWSALAGGDTNKLRLATEQFSQVTESVLKLHPDCGDLARALTRAIEITTRSGEAPTPALAMEVATAVLYLEAAYEDLDPTDSSMVQRSISLAHRLEHVNSGGQTEPLESWMEELYRRVSDRQIMGSVVDELRTALGDVEKSLDTFFRNPLDKLPLHEAPSRLAQMRGVFSVLGLDQAALACLRMRNSVEQFLVDDINIEAARGGIFEKLGNSLGAMGLLIDMLSYQRALAKTLFVYDEDLGEFKPLMGREKTAPEPAPIPATTGPSPEPVAPPIEEAPLASPAEVAPALEPAPAAAAEPLDDDAMELQDIFLEEAREVVQTGLDAIAELRAAPKDLAQQTTLRRAFHTLKGSSRMVGLNEFGEAAWAMEQLLNSWLADQKPASEALISLSDQAMQGFGRWVEDIASGNAAHWEAQVFRRSADGLRLHGESLALVLPGEEVPTAVPSEAPATALAPTPELPALPPELPDLDFSDLSSVTQATEATPPEPAAQDLPQAPAETTAGQDEQRLAEALPEPSPPTVEVQADTGVPAATLDDQVKVIGDLRIDIPLYNVYLNEADEWSRRLLTELGEWALELPRTLPDSAVALAHSLAGSSATIGFVSLSSLARALEHAMQHVGLHSQSMPEHAQVFVATAEDIRRLLHQFAAGFLKDPDPKLVEALQAIQALVFPAPTDEDVQAPDEELTLDTQAPTPDRMAASPLPEAAAESSVSAQETISARDRLDVDLFPIFEEEAQELLPQLGTALRQWTARPDNLGARAEVLRVLHTLKGSARLAGAMYLGEMTHRMESSILERSPEEGLPPAQQEFLLSRFDALQARFEQLRALPAQEMSLPEAGPIAPEPAPVEAAPAVEPPAELEAVPASPPSAPAPVVLPPAIEALAPPRPASSQTVRVRSQLLERLVNQAGEVMISRSRMEARLGQLRGTLVELAGNLDRLRAQLRDIELQSESQMQSRLAQTKESAQAFDPLEFDRFTRVQELTRMMAESVHDVATVQRNMQRTLEGAEDDLIAQGRQARELQRDLLRTRMVEFDSIAGRLHGVVRQAARDTGKQAGLHIHGGSLEIDRGVLERMATVFEHVLRNAVAHGIESPAQRRASGKPEAGELNIHLHQQGNDVTLEFVDDGAGLDLDRIREKARASGQISGDAVLSDAQAAQLIFAPGLSTAAQVTELAGRGIGLDVVRSEVNALGGRIEIATQRGQGTTFKLVLPLTTAVTQVVMLRMGELVIGVPASLVEMVRRVPLADLERAYREQVFQFGGEPVPFFWGGALFQASAQSSEAKTKTVAVAIFRSAGQRVATHVDEVLGNQEVVVKNLGPQLSLLPGLTGMSMLASGAVVLIYNPVALVAVYGEQARRLGQEAVPAADTATLAPTPASLLPGAGQAPLVLVVDDSITVRRVTQRLLKREGFRVALASDGLQALERLQEERPAVVLSDIEMPRMDGFDLARNIRADARLRDLPIIMITSRIAEKHRDYARELGVDHYLGKPYAEDQLIELVRHYCATQAEIAD